MRMAYCDDFDQQGNKRSHGSSFLAFWHDEMGSLEVLVNFIWGQCGSSLGNSRKKVGGDDHINWDFP